MANELVNNSINQFTVSYDLDIYQPLKNLLNAHKTCKFSKFSSMNTFENSRYLRLYIFYSIIRRKLELNEKEDIRSNFNKKYNGQNPFPGLMRLLNVDNLQEQITMLTDYLLNSREKFLRGYYQILEAELQFIEKNNYYYDSNNGYDKDKLLNSLRYTIQTKDNPQDVGTHELICLNQALLVNFKQLRFYQDRYGYQLDETNFINRGTKDFQLVWMVVETNIAFPLNNNQPVFILLDQGTPITQEQPEQKVTQMQQQNNKCEICSNPNSDIILQCSHSFHKKCLVYQIEICLRHPCNVIRCYNSECQKDIVKQLPGLLSQLQPFISNETIGKIYQLINS